MHSTWYFPLQIKNRMAIFCCLNESSNSCGSDRHIFISMCRSTIPVELSHSLRLLQNECMCETIWWVVLFIIMCIFFRIYWIIVKFIVYVHFIIIIVSSCIFMFFGRFCNMQFTLTHSIRDRNVQCWIKDERWKSKDIIQTKNENGNKIF